VLGFAVLSGLALAGVALSLFGLFHSASWTRTIEKRVQTSHAASLSEIQAAQEALVELAGQIRDPQQGPGAQSASAQPALSRDKRTRALRMYRMGKTPEQISVALHVPLTEIGLLLKVYRILIRNIDQKL
jgi:hypothetical protein